MITFPPVVAGDEVRISASTYLSFRDCPAKAGARFDHVYGPDSLPAFRGGLAHQIFARHLREGPIDDAGFAQACYEEIGAKHLNVKIGSLNLKPSAIRAVIEEVGALYQRFKAFPSDGFDGAEVAIEVEPSPGVTLVGTIDAVFLADGGVRLVDWKTGNLGEPMSQLRFYAMLWWFEKGSFPSIVEAYSVKTGEQRAEPPTRDAVQETVDEVAAMVETLRGSWNGGPDLERRAGPWCRYCPLLDDCPEGLSAQSVLHPSVAGERAV